MDVNSAANRSGPACLRDIVDVVCRPTVVRLDHLDADWISGSYYITEQVRHHLHALRIALRQPQGRGMFLIGPYGSGKSHFLAYVIRQIRGDNTEGQFLRELPGCREELPHVVALSLLNHRGDRHLEDIVCDRLADSYDGDARQVSDRREWWNQIDQRYPGGVLLVIDELSEFLRSKPNIAAFHEDVRFLQFMGEWAEGHGLWILAAMQEQIEHVGELEYSLYRKIKDRYPLRFLLNSGHVRDLVADHLLVKKEGYQEVVDKVVAELRRGLPGKYAGESILRDIFPIHPATLSLLEEVRDRFSQSRGVVEFVIGQLGGMPERRIAPFLDRSRDSLLTPEIIVDHFRDLFELQPDYVPIAQQLFPYYARQLESLFPTDKQRQLAERLLKLLVLTDISPNREGLKVNEAAEWLGYRAATIDPEKNQAVIRRVLQTLVDEGRYVQQNAEGYYVLNLHDDGGVALERFLDREKSDLRTRPQAVWDLLVEALPSDAFHPFQLPQNQWQMRQVRWHFHQRPYRLFVGDADFLVDDRLSVCVRLPWGERSICQGVMTILPLELEADEDLLELLALSKAQERYWSDDDLERIKSRWRKQRQRVSGRVTHAYRQARVIGIDGSSIPVTVAQQDHFSDCVDHVVLAGLQQKYPSFDRFAPVHGPLAANDYRAWVRFGMEQDWGEAEAPDEVRLIREAYLVPMKLLRRKGRGYEWPRHPENAELVQLVMPLIHSGTPIKAIYEHLQAPVYGLVPDQVSLLLLYLLVLGDIDIRKGTVSYRDAYETIPNPVQYDRIEVAYGLADEHRRELQLVGESFELRIPKRWSATGQRRLVDALAEELTERAGPLQNLEPKIAAMPGGQKAAGRLRRFLERILAFVRSDDRLAGFVVLVQEFGSGTQLCGELAEHLDWAEQLDGLLENAKRYQHLLTHPVVLQWDDLDFLVRLESLGSPPDVGRLDQLQQWLAHAERIYSEYTHDYRDRHDAWWRAIDGHPIWKWQSHPLLKSRHLGLATEVAELGECVAQARQLRCRQQVRLDLNPVCHCGFSGRDAAISPFLQQFETLHARVDQSLLQFFQQPQVRQRVERWSQDGIEDHPTLKAYLNGETELPVIHNVALFDQYLAGVQVVHEISAAEWNRPFQGRSWNVDDLVRAVRTFLETVRESRVRIKDDRRQAEGNREAMVATWCLQRCLAEGVKLPSELSPLHISARSDEVRPEWVGRAASRKVDALGLGQEIEDRISQWLLSGKLTLPQNADTEYVQSLLDMSHSPLSKNPSQLAELSRRAYRQHNRLMRVTRQRYLTYLDALATVALPETPPRLTDVLEHHLARCWIVLDAAGLPLLDEVLKVLPEWLPGWSVDQLTFAMVSAKSTTDAWLREMVEGDGSSGKAFHKFNSIDERLHGDFLELPDLWRVARAELSVSFRRLAEKFAAEESLLLFADHGFRLSSDGRRYLHGGSSTLERLVPVIVMTR